MAGSPTTSATRSSSVPHYGSATVASQRTPRFDSAIAVSLPPAKPANAVSPWIVTPAGARMMSGEGPRWVYQRAPSRLILRAPAGAPLQGATPFARFAGRQPPPVRPADGGRPRGGPAPAAEGGPR